MDIFLEMLYKIKGLFNCFLLLRAILRMNTRYYGCLDQVYKLFQFIKKQIQDYLLPSRHFPNNNECWHEWDLFIWL